MFEGQAELRVNLQWIQVARVKTLRPDEKHENVELSATMLKTVQSNFSKIDLGLDVCQLTCHRGRLR